MTSRQKLIDSDSNQSRDIKTDIKILNTQLLSSIQCQSNYLKIGQMAENRGKCDFVLVAHRLLNEQWL